MNYEGRLDLGVIHAVHPIFDGPGRFKSFRTNHTSPHLRNRIAYAKMRRWTYDGAVIGPHCSRFSSISRMSLSATNNTALANPQISRNGTINGSHTRTSVVSCSYYLIRSFRSSRSSQTRGDTSFAMGSANDIQDGRYHAISPPPPTATTISNNTAQASSIPATTGTLSRHNSSGDSGYTSSQQNNRWRHRDVMLKQNISPYSSDVSKWCPPNKNDTLCCQPMFAGLNLILSSKEKNARYENWKREINFHKI